MAFARLPVARGLRFDGSREFKLVEAGDRTAEANSEGRRSPWYAWFMQQLGFWRLESLADGALLDGLVELVGSGRRVLAHVVAHLAEVEERRLHLDGGYGSMFAYCVRRLGFSED